ncbi:Fic family protein [Parabacteroides sp.]
MDHINLSQHSKNRKTYVTQLVDAGLLAMTIPDKPNDMRQRYVRTGKPTKS